MTTYHITAEPRPGQNSAPRDCPLMPQDYIADSEREAVAFGEKIMDEDAPYFRGHVDKDLGPLFQYSDKPAYFLNTQRR